MGSADAVMPIRHAIDAGAVPQGAIMKISDGTSASSGQKPDRPPISSFRDSKALGFAVNRVELNPIFWLP